MSSTSPFASAGADTPDNDDTAAEIRQAGLGSLFTNPGGPDPDIPASPPVRVDESAQSTLGVLFASPAEAPEPPAPAARLDLADIFTPVDAATAGTNPEPNASPENVHADTSEAAPILLPRTRKKPVPAALVAALTGAGGAPAAVTMNTASPAPVDLDTAPAALGITPVGPTTRTTESRESEFSTVAADESGLLELGGAAGPRGVPTERPPAAETAAPGVAVNETNSQRARHPAAGAYVPPDTTVEDAQRQTRHARRAIEIERSWPVVDQILSALRSDVMLQNLVDQLELTGDLARDSQQRAEFFAAMRPRLAAAGVSISSPSDVDVFLGLAYDEILNVSVLGDVWRDPDITEIMVDRWDVITVERNGRLEKTAYRFRDSNHANSVARKLAAKISDRAVSQSIPLVTAELPRARITIAFGSVVKGGLSIVIRKFRDLLGLEDLLQLGALNEEMVEFLQDAVQARVSVLVSGGTGTGKTTMINMLSSFIPDSERVITIEDAFELQLANTHVVSLQTKEASSRDDTVRVTLPDLLRNTLRMRPDRIIVGEIREAEGAMVVISAAGTGHEGTITTIHANSADDAVNERLTDLMAQARKASDVAVRRSITSAFDLVVQVTRGRNGRRFISEIVNLTRVGSDGVINIDPIFNGEERNGSVTFTRAPVQSDTTLGRRLIERGGERWVAI